MDDFSLSDSEFKVVMEDFNEKTGELFALVITPVGDKLGYTATLVSQDPPAELCKASAADPVAAIMMAYSRGMVAYEEAMERIAKNEAAYNEASGEDD